MMDIGERVSVVASFGVPYRIKPLRFRWAGRMFKVTDITYRWQTRQGQKTIHHFSVSDGRTLYELSFDPHSLVWTMEHLEA